MGRIIYVDINIIKNYYGDNVGEGIVSQVLKLVRNYFNDCRE